MKVLIIQFYQIGDVILTTSLPREIKKAFPNAKVDFLTTSVPAQLLESNPCIDNVIIIDRKKKSLNYFLKFALSIRDKKYDCILDCHNNPRSMWITLLSGAERRVTFSFTKRKFAYNILITQPDGYIGQQKIVLLKAINIISNNCRPELIVDKESLEKVQKYLKIKGIDDYVVFSPTHRRVTRRWPLKYFITVAEYIFKKYSLKVIFNYAPDEIDYVSPIKEHELFDKGFYMNPFSLKELVALISKAKFHVGNDSAPNHIATALDTPSFTVFGSTNPMTWIYPGGGYEYVQKGLECQPCNNNNCKFNRIKCLEELQPEEVIIKLDKYIKRIMR